MHYETSRTAPATSERAWKTLTDIEGWPKVIAIYQSVRRGEQGPLQVGSTAEVKQKGLRAGTWRVTAMTDGQTFTWENTQPGLRSVARHSITEQPGGEMYGSTSPWSRRDGSREWSAHCSDAVCGPT